MEPTPESLLQRMRAGEAAAVAEYFETNRHSLLGYIQSRLGPSLKSRVEPEDILQEVSMVALKRLADLAVPGREPFPWFCHIAEQKIIDTHRRLIGTQKRAGDRQVSLGTQNGDASHLAFEEMLVASMTTPSEALSRNQKLMRLLAAIQQLPPKKQEILKLRYMEGLTTREIAERVGSSDAAIRVLLSRAVAQLQEILEKT
ncbi:MAG: RNA polymerase sigma factor [Planctomycetaceae bacterium]